MTRYRIEAGAGCRIRRRGESRWQPHRTTRQLTFTARGEDGQDWTFERDGWELRVSRRLVTVVIDGCRDQGPHPLFSQKALKYKGRGRNQRRNAKLRKRHGKL